MRALLLCLLAACGGTERTHETTPTEAQAAPIAPAPATEREPLGQTRLVAMPSHSPIVTLRVVFDAGSAEDPAAMHGLTNLTAQLMLLGGAGDRDYAALTRALYPMAAELEVSTDRDSTVFVGRVHEDHLDDFYAIFHDVLARPRLRQDDFARVRTQLLSELTQEMRSDDDEALGKEALQAMIYENHPYAMPPLGTESGLHAITRDAVAEHREHVFCGPRAIVGVAGHVPDGFAERLERDVAAITSDRCEGRVHLGQSALELSAGARPARRVLVIDKPGADSVAISMGVPVSVTREDEDYPALFVAAAYLGQHRQFIGQLMQKIREQRGMNYGDYAYAEHFDQEGWSTFPSPNVARRAQYFSVWLRPVRPEHAAFAIRFAARELADLREQGISQESFEQVRDYLDGYLALFLQTESARLGFAIDDVTYGIEAPYLERMRTALRALTAERVSDAFRRHVALDAMQIAVVAPDGEALATQLGLRTLPEVHYEGDRTDAMRVDDARTLAFDFAIPRERIQLVPVAEIFQ